MTLCYKYCTTFGAALRLRVSREEYYFRERGSGQWAEPGEAPHGRSYNCSGQRDSGQLPDRYVDQFGGYRARTATPLLERQERRGRILVDFAAPLRFSPGRSARMVVAGL